MYKQLAAPVSLASAVQAFWVYAHEGPIEHFTVLPDGCVDLLLDLERRQLYLSGPMDSCQALSLADKTTLIGMRMQPEQFGQLFGVPLRGAKNLRLEAEQLLPSLAREVRRLANPDAPSVDGLSVLGAAIAQLARDKRKGQDPVVLQVLQQLRTARGNVRVKALAAACYLSPRQLERRFSAFVGLSVKTYAGILRFQHAQSLIANRPRTSLMELAYEAGYVDHSHLNKAFRTLAGRSPSSFR